MDIPSSLIDWLRAGPGWMQYALARDLLPAESALPSMRNALLQDPAVQALLADVANEPRTVLTSHKAAGHPLHKIVFLADLGLSVADAPIAALAENLLAKVSPEGPLRVMMNISPKFGGSGQDQLAWALCDAPLGLHALAQFGLRDHPAVLKGAAFLAGLVRDNGWPCAASPELAKFRGPGRKEDACPFANLIMLQALAHYPEYRDSPAVHSGIQSALAAWAGRRQHHPYMFYMGDDFCKLKAPLVWYDLLHVLDVLARFPMVHADPRFQDMLACLRAKSSDQGRFTPESVWLAWKDWEFGQKKAPSRWLTFIAWRILSASGVMSAASGVMSAASGATGAA